MILEHEKHELSYSETLEKQSIPQYSILNLCKI